MSPLIINPFISLTTFTVGILLLSIPWPVNLFLLAMGITLYVRGRRRKILEYTAKNPQTQWQVTINDVDVGTLPDAQYQAIRQQVIENWEFHVAVFFRWIRDMIGTYLCALRAGFVVICLGAIALVFVDDGREWVTILTELQTASATQVVQTAQSFITFVVTLSLVCLVLMYIFVGAKLWPSLDGYDNAINQRIRRTLHISATGDIHVSRVPTFVVGGVTS